VRSVKTPRDDVCVCVCMCRCVHVFYHTHTDTQTHRHTHTHTHTHTHLHTRDVLGADEGLCQIDTYGHVTEKEFL